ncbi:MBL fold metallo-hydrolase [Desulfitobacterium sp.]|uniref:MBL fold metallo-hydrolase n=1 Tax=Desulfitobacterium sp. TaxID=49981 RepID=UPI002CF9DE8B|nr:MBL fold metallo-hydrolase [Desulfitobacterium sp.]HVJ49964.1 MBL fold metallo-hydrolase [Desulfitobacterium sp.]
MTIRQEQDVWIFNQPVNRFGTNLNLYVYIIDGILIDTGPHCQEQQVSEFCEKVLPKKIVHTHFHEDHTGNTAYLARQFSLPVYLQSKALEICAQDGKIPFYRQLFWGKRAGFSARPLPEFIESENLHLKVISAPGHTPDHVVFLDQHEGRLFTGDLFVHPKTRLTLSGENIPQIIQSLRDVLQEDFQTVYCSHSGVITNGYHQIQQKLQNLEELSGKVLQLSNKGYSPREIRRRIFPKTPSITFFSGGEWSSLNVIHSILNDSRQKIAL